MAGSMSGSSTMLRAAPQAFRPQPVEEMRANFAILMATFAVPTDARRTATTLGGRPAVLVELEPDAHPGTILYFPGGSFAPGSPDTAMGLTASLVSRTGFTAVSLAYRLAPEHPFPTAIEDAVAAYRALLESGVDVILDVTANVPHVFQSFAGILDESDQALDRAALFLQQHLA
jgi:acetyl esterase/lipase